MKRNDVDWALLRQEYEQGNISQKNLAAQHGVSLSAVQYHARTEKWRKTGDAKSGDAKIQLSAAAQQLSRMATERLRQCDSEELATKEMKELTAMLKELGALMRSFESETKEETIVRVVLENEVRQWSE